MCFTSVLRLPRPQEERRTELRFAPVQAIYDSVCLIPDNHFLKIRKLDKNKILLNDFYWKLAF